MTMAILVLLRQAESELNQHAADRRIGYLAYVAGWQDQYLVPLHAGTTMPHFSLVL